MKRLIAAVAKLVGRTPVWEIPKTKLTAPVPKEKRIRNPLLPIVIVLISLVLSLVIWNTITLSITLSQIQQKQERLWVELYGTQLKSPYGTPGDLRNMKRDLSDMQEQLDTLLIKLDNTQRDVAIIKYYLER